MNEPLLHLVCRPWLVAIPLIAVVRILPAEAVHPDGADVLTADGARWRTVELAGLLGLPAAVDEESARVLLLTADGPVCLVTGRCLNVRPLPAPNLAVPVISNRWSLPLSCFAAGELARQHDLAPFGLLLDPVVWLARHQFPIRARAMA